MNTYKSVWWSIDLATGWAGSSAEECYEIVKPDGLGALHISSYRKDEKITKDDVLELMELDEDAIKHVSEKQWGEFNSFQLAYSDVDAFWRVWWLYKDNLLIYATYNCNLEDKGKESEDVDFMMKTIKVNLTPG